MRRIYSFISLSLFLVLSHFFAGAQTTINTTVGSSNYTGSNGAGANYAITFVIENNSGGGILLTGVGNWYTTGQSGAVQLWYSSTSLSGSYGTLSGPTWTQIGTGTETCTSNGVTPCVFTPALSFLIPNGATYRFALNSASYCHYSGASPVPTPSSFTSGGVTLHCGDYQIANMNVGYGSTNNPRWFTGSITFSPAGPCTSPPTPGTATSSSPFACANGNFTLGLTGNSGGTGQTYQWQTGASSTGPWTNIGASSSVAGYVTSATATAWYRCAVTCSANTAYSSPVQVSINPNLPAGTYTINSAVPTGGTNYHSFTDAVAALSCGIAGPVIFNVNPTSGPYNEQISIPNIINTSAVNTVTFNCNNRTLTYNGGVGNYAVLRLDGADYVRIKKLVVLPTGASQGFGINLTNGADHNIIDSCKVDNGMTSTSSTKSCIQVGSTSTSATASGGPCDSNVISNSEFIGGYYCMTSVGASGNLQQHNQFINNLARDYYYYGLYMLYNNGHVVEGNEFHRENRPSASTFYGIVNSTGNLNAKISKNRIHDPFGMQPTSTSSGYFLYNSASGTSGNENIFSNNVVYNMQGRGTQYIMYSQGAYGRFYFNTISSDYAGATSGTTYGFYQSSSSYAGIESKNNIISITRGGTGTRYCVYNSNASYSTVYDHNNYYVSGSSNKIGYTGTAQVTLANWQNATGKDANSMSVNPNFVGASTGDLTPANLSMDNIGTPISGITTDITGFTRNAATPDAGAFEFNNCNPVTGLTASAYTTTSITITWNAVSGSAGYQYVIDQLPGNPPGAGTATTATSVPATGLTSGTQYYAHVRNSCGAASFSPWVTIPFTTCTQAAVTPGGTITFCAGDSIVLHANTGLSYQWKLNGNIISGATANQYTAMAAGNYTATINSANGCVSTSAAVTVQLTSPASAITPASAASVCPGSTTPLTGPAGAGYTYQWNLNNVPIIGATTMAFNAGTAGNYTVTVSSGPGCFATTATPTALSLYTPPPAVITPPANTAICPGSMVTLNANTGSGLHYQWYLGNNSLGGAATNAVYSGLGVGNYKVKVTSITTGCSTTSPVTTITQAVAPTAQASQVNGLTGCDSVLLTGNQGIGYTYQWLHGSAIIPGATNLIYGAPATGSYAVKVAGTNGCATTSAPVAVVVHPSPLSTITYSSPLIFCYGGGVALSVYTSNEYSYQWYENSTALADDTSEHLVVTTGGNYSVLVTDMYGCAKVSPAIQVVVNPLPTPVVTRNANVLSTGTYISYQWYMNNQPIPGANNQNYSTLLNGAYHVSVTDGNGCQNVSPTVFVNNTAVNITGFTAADIKVYPNPVKNTVRIDAPVAVDLILQDITGKTILTAKAATVLDVTPLAKGVYTLRIHDTEGNLLKTERVVKID